MDSVYRSLSFISVFLFSFYFRKRENQKIVWLVYNVSKYSVSAVTINGSIKCVEVWNDGKVIFMLNSSLFSYFVVFFDFFFVKVSSFTKGIERNREKHIFNTCFFLFQNHFAYLKSWNMVFSYSYSYYWLLYRF